MTITNFSVLLKRNVKKLTIAKFEHHIHNREYMDGDRTLIRIKQTGEIFTSTPLVNKLLKQIPKEHFADPNKTFLDPTCGDGQFLGEILLKKLEYGIDFETALGSLYGVDIMPDNVEFCKEHLLCGQNQFRHIVDKNIVCADALQYHFRFDGSPTDAEEYEKKMNLLFEWGESMNEYYHDNTWDDRNIINGLKNQREFFDDWDDEEFEKLLQDGKHILADGCIVYIKNKNIHKDNGPAVIYPDDSQVWYQNGQIHRDNGPAVEWPDGLKRWHYRGEIHRDDGPALINRAGDKNWYKHNQLHREDGPAVEFANGKIEWYLNYQQYDNFEEYYDAHPGDDEDKNLLKLKYG